MKMTEMFYAELADAINRRVPFVIPIGTMEYHAMHLNMGTDTMVITGTLDRLAEKKEIVICPPVWYGVSSYAVCGPEKCNLHVDVDAYEGYIASLLKSMIYGGNKNIYMVFHHQSEDRGLMPMSLACMKAGKKVIMEYLETTRGYGWWGQNTNKEYYDNLDASDNPFNYIKVIQLADAATQEKFGGFDHAGKFETSMMWALYPNSVDPKRMKDNTEWFAESAVEASPEFGEHMVACALEYLERVIV